MPPSTGDAHDSVAAAALGPAPLQVLVPAVADGGRRGGLALAAVALDEAVSDRWLQSLSWAYNGGAEGASPVLGTIAGSMITIAGVVFSMTLVALTLASSQLGPRLLRNFMRDTVNQAVIGTFVSTFVYCLLVLRTIRRADEVAFVPHLAVTLGVLLALVSLGVLIYFIHHVAVSIQADQVIARVGKELFESIERLYPRRIGDAPEGADPRRLPPHGPIRTTCSRARSLPRRTATCRRSTRTP